MNQTSSRGHILEGLSERLGSKVLGLAEPFQSAFDYTQLVLRLAFKKPFRKRLILQQMEFFGARSFPIVAISGFFIGAVFSLQLGYIFRIFGAHSLLGAASAKALLRELSPLVAGFLLTGRGGAAITAEIGTMKVNEQIDAMEAMAVDPLSYLVVPRVWAGTLMMPLLVSVFSILGMFGSHVVGTVVFDVDQAVFWDKISRLVKVRDIFAGLEKACVFGFIITIIATRFGLQTRGGAKGVGLYTTNSVVVTLLSLIGVDFVITFIQVAM